MLPVVGNVGRLPDPEVSPTHTQLLTIDCAVPDDCLCETSRLHARPDPLDNRVILACVTVKGERSCVSADFGCRSYAGSFPSLYYWFQLFRWRASSRWASNGLAALRTWCEPIAPW